MRQVLLLGSPGTKRTVYLTRETEEAGVPLKLLDWNRFREEIHEGRADRLFEGRQTFLKIDPPLWDSCRLDRLEELAGEYEKELDALCCLGKRQGITFLNHPRSIRELLNKRTCKDRLRKAGVPVTKALEEEIHNGEQLLEVMERESVPQVFLKPVKGSGAAGAAAFRYRKRTGQMALYTCGAEDPDTGCLVNTRRLRQFTDRRQVFSLLDRLLAVDCVAERWYAKAEHRGFSYDLRAVIQEGKVDVILARLSKGPITNLHLNNHPLPVQDLDLPPGVLGQVEALCERAAGQFQGLKSAGIDILLEKNTLRPRVIEMNGQGDLIYQDIYGENIIYRRQAEMMKEWLYGKT